MPETNLSRALTNVLLGKQWSDSEEHAENSTERIINLFSQSKTPISILLSTYNNADGIGDFKHLVDIEKWMIEIFSGIPSVNIQSIAFVTTTKIGNTKYVLPKGISVNDVYIMMHAENVEEVDEEKMKSAKLIIIQAGASDKWNAAVNKKIQSIPKFIEMGNSINFYLQISTPIECFPNAIFDKVPKSAWMQEWKEYGSMIYTKEGKLHENKVKDVPLIRKYMGVREEDTGIKFRDDCKYLLDFKGNNQQLPDSEKANLLANFVNRKLLAKLVNAKDPNQINSDEYMNYVKNNSLNVGYLQHSKYAATYFLTILAATTPKSFQTIDVVIPVDKDLLTPELENTLKKYGITHIEIINNDGSVADKKILDDSQNPKTLRIIDYRGLDDKDLIALYGLATFIGGSGDSSFTDTFLGKLPYFQLPIWKKAFYRNLIDYVAANNPNNENDKLIEYLKKIMELAKVEVPKIEAPQSGAPQSGAPKVEVFQEQKLNEICEFLVANYEEIAKAWQKISAKIYLEKNAKDSFNELVLGFVVTNIFENSKNYDDLKFIVELISHNNKQGKLANDSLLHMAILKENPIALQACIDANLSVFDRPPLSKVKNDTTQQPAYSALEFAIKRNWIIGVQTILQSVKLTDNDLTAAFTFAVMDRKAAIAQLFLNMIDKESTPLEYCIKKQNWDLLKLLLTSKDLVSTETAFQAISGTNNQEMINLYLERFPNARDSQVQNKMKFFDTATLSDTNLKPSKEEEQITVDKKP